MDLKTKTSYNLYAQDEDRKLLYKHFGIIKTFAQDVLVMMLS